MERKELIKKFEKLRHLEETRDISGTHFFSETDKYGNIIAIPAHECIDVVLDTIEKDLEILADRDSIYAPPGAIPR